MTYKLSILASAFFLTGIVVIVLLFLRTVRNLRLHGAAVRQSSKRLPVVKVVTLLVGVGFVVLSQFLFWVGASLTAFQHIDPDRPVAVIGFSHVEGSDPTMNLATRTSGSEQMVSIDVVMRSEAAALEIEVLRFPEWFGFLDMTDSYRISSVKFIEAQDDSQSDVAEKRIQQNVESLWRFFERLGTVFPAIDATKITSDPVYFEAGKELYVYTSASRVVLAD